MEHSGLNELIGALIALARAAENETPDAEANLAMLEGLALAGTAAPEPSALDRATAAIRAAKDRLVPMCAGCANPCGRTSEYSLRELIAEPDRQRTALRLSLLFALEGLARSALADSASGASDEELLSFFYLGLFALGYPFEAERMQQLLSDCGRHALALLERRTKD